ncbi:MAG: L,D-transpeptidase family protein [Methylotetracoccus sp.]
MITRSPYALLIPAALVLLLAGCSANRVEEPQPQAAAVEPPKKSFKPRYMTRIPVPEIPLTFSRWRTVEDVLRIYGPESVEHLAPYFERAGVDYPPRELTLLALKSERRMELWAPDRRGRNKLIRSYDIMAASGTRGPKLREGDRQVPEGIYRLVTLNPNSNYHLSMKLNYPNSFDLYHASEEGRTHPGGEIFIHGKAVSAGCLAMGDAAIEDLFVLVGHVGKENVKVVIAPHDPRVKPLTAATAGLPEWVPELYQSIAYEVGQLQTPRNQASAEPVGSARRF